MFQKNETFLSTRHYVSLIPYIKNDVLLKICHSKEAHDNKRNKKSLAQTYSTNITERDENTNMPEFHQFYM